MPEDDEPALRYYLDADLSRVSAQIARDAGLDVISSHEVGMDAASDREQLRYATEQGRLLVTQDFGDFRGIAREWVNAGFEFRGILMLPNSITNNQFARIARAIIRFHREHPDPEGVPAYYFDFLRADEP